MDNNLLAEIIVDNKSRSTDKTFTYLIGDEFREDIKIGMRVLVPFGKGNKTVEGIVVGFLDNSKIERNKLKYIDTIIDPIPLLSPNMVELAYWMKDKYLSKYIDVFRTIMPSGITKKVKRYCKVINDDINLRNSLNSENEIRIIDYLSNNGDTEIKSLGDKLGIINIYKNIKKLENIGLIKIYEEIDSNVKKKYQKFIIKNFKDSQLEEILNSINERAYKQKDVIKYLENKEKVSLKEILTKLNTSSSTIKSLEDKKILKIIDEEVKRNPINKHIPTYEKVSLTKEQDQCLKTIYKDITNKNYNQFLLHGVTGSGKTEVYLQLIEKMIENKKQSIVLVPEISLTPQTVERFVGRFGKKVAVLHSRLSLGERFDEWCRIKEGKVNIVVGARSAIFAPFNNLGLIIIDEEHETSYKSSMDPKYNTYEVAQKLCELEDASLVLGSATPSIETYYKGINGNIKLLTLSKRANNKEIPPIEIVDMKNELDNGNKSIFSSELYNAIKNNLESKEQTILFLNRRGFSTFISCRKCGYVAKCKECDISLTYHISNNMLKCHYCGLAVKPPKICPECNSKYIKYFGIGTQRVEEIVKKYFPNAKVARMDVDTTTKKGSHEKILNKVKEGKVDILIGTQMISKGLDFPNVTLVGIIAADITLNLPDFKASERTFQLITQVGGRSGRGELEGRIILQTYEPDHYSITSAKDHDYISFYKKEIKLREEFDYPPFKNIISITLSGKNESKVSSGTNAVIMGIFKRIRENGILFNRENILGPNPSPISKIKNNYRWQLIIKTSDLEFDIIKDIIEDVCITNNIIKDKETKISIDINPISIM